MEKLNKRSLADTYFGEEDAGTDIFALKARKGIYKAGLEYAEEHYLAKLQQEIENNAVNENLVLSLQAKNKELEEVLSVFKQNQAKELLKEIKIVTYSHLNRNKDMEMSNKIEEFLK